MFEIPIFFAEAYAATIALIAVGKLPVTFKIEFSKFSRVVPLDTVFLIRSSLTTVADNASYEDLNVAIRPLIESR